MGCTVAPLLLSLMAAGHHDTPQEQFKWTKPSIYMVCGNLLAAALIERISKCFGNKMKGLTADTLKGTCFPFLALAGSFSSDEISRIPAKEAYPLTE